MQQKQIYNNFKDATWFAPNTEVILLGLGSIGSWVGLNLARQGYEIYAYDHDHYEPHNLGSQLTNTSSINKTKGEVFKSFANEFGNNQNINLLGKYDEESMTGNIVISCFDNMEARKIAFKKWKDYQLSKTKEYRLENPNEINIFIDGRLQAEVGICFAVNSKSDIELYEKTLYDDSEIETQPCSYRQTTHSGMIIGGLMTSLLLNQISNKLTFEYRFVPFSTHFELLNLSFTCSKT